MRTHCNGIFVGGISIETSAQEINNFFYKFSYDVRSIRLFQGFAFVTLYSRKDVERAIRELNGKLIRGKKVTIEHPRSGPRNDYYSRSRNLTGGEAYRLKVDNLPLSVTWKDLKQFMQQAGKVLYADSHRFQAGKGVVHFETRRGMITAMEVLNGQALHRNSVYLYSPKIVQNWRYAERCSYIPDESYQREYYFCNNDNRNQLYPTRGFRRDLNSETMPRSTSPEAQTEKWNSKSHSEQQTSYAPYNIYDERRAWTRQRYIREVYYPLNCKPKRLISDEEFTPESRLKRLKITPESSPADSQSSRRMSTPYSKISSKRRELFHSSRKDMDSFIINPNCSGCSGKDYNLDGELKTFNVRPYLEAETDPPPIGRPRPSSVVKPFSYSVLRHTRSLNRRPRGPRTPLYSPPPSSEDESPRKCKPLPCSYDLEVEDAQNYDSKIMNVEKINTEIISPRLITTHRLKAKNNRTSPSRCFDDSYFADINVSDAGCFSPCSEPTSSCSKNARLDSSFSSLMHVSDIGD